MFANCIFCLSFQRAVLNFFFYSFFYFIVVRADSTEYILPYPQIISNVYRNSARTIHAVYCQDRLPKRKNIFLLQLHKQRLGLIICVSEWHPALATILANLCFLSECNVAIDWNVLQSSFPLQKNHCSNQKTN